MKQDNNLIKYSIYGLLIMFGLIILFSSFYIVSAGERAVLITLGNPSEQSYGSGLHFKFPLIQSVIKFETKTKKYESEGSAASSDLQTVSAKVAVNYHLDPEGVVNLYKTVGVDYESRIIQPLEQEIIKSITSKYTAEELITKREQVRLDIKETLKERLSPRDIIVEEVSITNFDFSKSFNEAIEAKVTAEQQALAAKNKLEQIKFEAEQTVAKAQAEATSLKLQKAEITPDLVRLRQIEVQKMAIEKWNGNLPLVTGGSMPFIDMSSMVGNSTR